MELSKEQELKKDISSDSIKPIYFIFGNDDYLKKFYVSKLSEAAFQGDATFNFQQFDDECDITELCDSVWQFPLMADRKCVVLTDYDYEKCSKDDFDKILNLVEEPCDTTVLIIYMNSIEPSLKNERSNKLKNAAAKSGRAVCLDHRTRSELISMLCSGAKKRGCQLNSLTAGYMIDCCSNDINVLKSELEKLTGYCKDREITKADVDKVCIRTVEASVFNLSKEIISARSAAALKILDELLYLRVDPFAILSTLSGTYIDMMRVLAARNAGQNNMNVIKDFSYPKNKEFLVEKAVTNLRRFDEDKINLSLNALCEADMALKISPNEQRIVLEKLICELIFIVLRGKV